MISATSAGVVCANHAYMPLWGHPAADVGACALAAAAATTTGLSRIVADRHYATDAILAGALGFGIGYMVPTLLHYTAGASDAGAIVAMPSISGGHAGLSLGGTF
jgi:membrane-associated phospholipid phosphatase